MKSFKLLSILMLATVVASVSATETQPGFFRKSYNATTKFVSENNAKLVEFVSSWTPAWFQTGFNSPATGIKMVTDWASTRKEGKGMLSATFAKASTFFGNHLTATSATVYAAAGLGYLGYRKYFSKSEEVTPEVTTDGTEIIDNTEVVTEPTTKITDDSVAKAKANQEAAQEQLRQEQLRIKKYNETLATMAAKNTFKG